MKVRTLQFVIIPEWRFGTRLGNPTNSIRPMKHTMARLSSSPGWPVAMRCANTVYVMICREENAPAVVVRTTACTSIPTYGSPAVRSYASKRDQNSPKAS
ncbi:hypothetical protein PMIN05_010184 [Paraphaeosphaeria minitans]